MHFGNFNAVFVTVVTTITKQKCTVRPLWVASNYHTGIGLELLNATAEVHLTVRRRKSCLINNAVKYLFDCSFAEVAEVALLILSKVMKKQASIYRL